MQLRSFRIPAIRDRFKLVFLLCLILTIYLPSLQSGFFVFDDFAIVESIKQIDGKDIWKILESPSGRYWRPLTMLSFLFDINILNANSSLMHLHNILLHTANTILVFFIVRFLWGRRDLKNEYPLLAATLFAIHPVNTEAVNWISDRTDLLASLFALAGTYIFLLSIHSKRIYFSILSALLFMLGCLAKEVAFPLFPAAILSLFLFNKKQPHVKQASKQVLKVVNGLPFLLAGLSYLWFRSCGFHKVDLGIAKVINNTNLDGPSHIDNFFTGITALGFYIKKLLIPYPLNFAIDHVSPLYLWIGLLSIFLAFFLIYKRNIESIVLLFMFFTISTAILNAIYHIAWTPYAERYLYLPSAFMCTYLFAPHQLIKAPISKQKFLVLIIFIIAIALTSYRNTQWGDYSTVLEDAIRQNPDNTALRINYAVILEERLGPLPARDELNIALERDPENQFARRNLALISQKSLKDPLMARNDLNVFFNGEQDPKPSTLSIMIDVNKERLLQDDASSFQNIRKELFLSQKKYFLITGNSSDLFATVDTATSIDELESVSKLLQKTSNDPSTSETTRATANKLLMSIKQREQKEFGGSH